MHWKCIIGCKCPLGVNQNWDSVEHDQKLIRLGEAHDEFVYQIAGQSDQQFD